MIPTLLLAFALLSASPGSAQHGALAPEPQPALTAETEATKAAPELARLDQVLALAQEAKKQGRLAPERYEEFLLQFRGSLDTARTVTPPSPAASALYARILARLGEPQEALAALTPALEQDPDNPNLRVALGHVRYEEKNYPAALAEAEAVLKRDPANKEALALKYFSQGRASAAPNTAGIAPSAALPAAGLEETSILHDPRSVEAGRRALARQSAVGLTDKAMGRLKIADPHEALRFLALAEAIDPGYADVPMQQGLAYMDLKQHAAAVERFTQAEALWRSRATPQTDELAGLARKMSESEAAELIQNSKSAQPETTPRKRNIPSPKDDGVPLWPLFPAFGLGAAAYAVAKSRRTVESEDGFNEDDRPQPGKYQRFVAGSILAGLAGAGLYLGGAYAVGTGAPLVARFMAGPGQQAVRLAQSEAGAINPSETVGRGVQLFEIHPRVIQQLADIRLGPLTGKITPADLQRLANNQMAQRVFDARSGNINIIQEIDGVLLRITVPRDAMKIISVGPIRPNQVTNRLASGDFISLP